MQAFLDAIQAGASGDDIGNIPVPESYRAACPPGVHRGPGARGVGSA